MLYLTIKGDFYVKQITTTKGGGGGGSSLTGAIVGGMVAGAPGAIIASRKKVKPIEVTTKNVEVDKRVTIVEFKYKGETHYMQLGSSAYEFLLSRIPGKERDLVR